MWKPLDHEIEHLLIAKFQYDQLKQRRHASAYFTGFLTECEEGFEASENYPTTIKANSDM